MAQYNNNTQLGGILKDIWKSGVYDLYSFMTPVMNDLKLEDGAEAGGAYHVPIIMQLEHGITHAVANSTPGAAATQAYVRPRAGIVPDAQIRGVQTYLRAFVGYESLMDTLSRTSDSKSQKKAVASAMAVVTKSIAKSAALRGEMHAIHGGSPTGLGVVEVASNEVATTYESVSGFARDIRITETEWAAGIWSTLQGATIDCFNLSVSLVNKANATNNTNVLPTTSQAAIVIGLQPATLLSGLTGTSSERVIRLWHSVAGGLATFATAGNSLFVESGGPISSGMREMVGIDTMARVSSPELGAPTILHGLDATLYPNWAGNYEAAAGVLRLDGLMAQMAKPFNFGVMGAKYRALVSGELFGLLISDEAALRRYDDAKLEAKTGFAKLSFTGPGGNTVEIMAHPYQKKGKVTCYPVDEIHRVGTQELSFLKKVGENEFALEVADVAAGEIRGMGKYNTYAECNRHLLSINGITY